MGTLYYGDNLDILRRYVKDESVDLVYLDPPFNSAQNYNAFFQEIVIQVKSGKTSVRDVRDLRGVLERDKAAIGALITLDEPTAPMKAEAASAGFYVHKTNQQQYPRLQLRTVAELMSGKGIARPSSAAALDETFKEAPKAKGKRDGQKELEL